MIHTLTLNPALDKTVVIPQFQVNSVNRISSVRLDPGGKGINVSKVLQEMGGSSRATALLGGSTGQMILEMLQRQGVDVDCVNVPGQTRTNLKVIDPVLKTNTDINEPGVALTAEERERVFAHFTAQLNPGDIVVLAGSVPAGVPETVYAEYITACHKVGAKAFLDADSALFSEGIQAKPYLVKPNQDELGRFVGHPLRSLQEIKAAAACLVDFGIRKVVVSLGAEGALYMTNDVCLYAPALSVPVGSTVGAGDSVVAALALAEEQKMSDKETLRLAVATGAANVMCSGTQAADRQQIEALLPRVECRML